MGRKTLVSIATLLQVACINSESQHDGHREEVVSWEEYRAQAVAVMDAGRRYYVVEWDIVLSGEEALRAYYDDNIARSRENGTRNEGESIRRSPLAVYARWSTGFEPTHQGSDAQDIRYCVSDSFTSKSTVVADMAVGANDWLQHANVAFRYDPSQDGSCDHNNGAVDFAVMPTTAGFVACGNNKMFWNESHYLIGCPVGGSYVKGVLLLNRGTNPGDGVTWPGVVRHELGHILGFRHEHPWAPNSYPCNEATTNTASDVDVTGRRLTDYDQYSVMHYPYCGGISGADMTLSTLDGMGARAIYGMPASWYVPTVFSELL